MREPLPTSVYHADPMRSGVFAASPERCICCGQARGCLYTGAVYGLDRSEGSFCPWCIADGSAHERFAATFTDEAGIGGYGQWDAVPQEVIETIAFRTPCFIGWQQEMWWTHCGDGAVFLECVGYRELTRYGPEATAAIARTLDEEDGALLRALRKNGSPTAYLFQCRHCGAFGGYWDSD